MADYEKVRLPNRGGQSTTPSADSGAVNQVGKPGAAIRTSGLMSGGWKRGLDYRASLRLCSRIVGRMAHISVRDVSGGVVARTRATGRIRLAGVVLA